MMSTEHDFTINSEQYMFLDNHLKNVNRNITPWLIFAGHRPMYVDSTDVKYNFSDQPVAALLRQHIEPLLKVIATITVAIAITLYAIISEIWCQSGILGAQSLIPANLPSLQ